MAPALAATKGVITVFMITFDTRDGLSLGGWIRWRTHELFNSVTQSGGSVKNREKGGSLFKALGLRVAPRVSSFRLF